MRTIRKRRIPAGLVNWRQQRAAAGGADGFEFTYPAMRSNREVLEAVEDALHAEQGGICAYTGHRIQLKREQPRAVGFHLEHLKPQSHCEAGEDTDYKNLAACWPEPNPGAGVAYGAVHKGNWPPPEEIHLFVPPLRDDCSQRFLFDRNGNITPASPGDEAAQRTIEKLGLDNHELTGLRKAAIRGALNPAGRQLSLPEAEKLRRIMDEEERHLNLGEPVTLRPFCFAIRPQMDREIRKLEAIREKNTGAPR